MKQFILYILYSFILFVPGVKAQRLNTDANIVGHVKSVDEHLPFVSIVVEGTTMVQ
ncbi:hypothetical protein [Prolixibacter bellariivorans]|uniref:hypothetical protein n=1 Tax=Prolixibacter bellariivorans TaxID=314319 RepID=UPI0019015E58|nr:hypothetical protein [Prolixibacter bellariivorans]